MYRNSALCYARSTSLGFTFSRSLPPPRGKVSWRLLSLESSANTCGASSPLPNAKTMSPSCRNGFFSSVFFCVGESRRDCFLPSKYQFPPLSGSFCSFRRLLNVVQIIPIHGPKSRRQPHLRDLVQSDGRVVPCVCASEAEISTF